MIVISLVIFYFIVPPKKSRLFSKRFYKKEFWGIVKEKFIDSKNHNSKVINIHNLKEQGKEVIKICTPSGNEDIYSFVNIGDTLNKNSFSNKIVVSGLKLDTTIVFKLKYP